MADLTKQYYLNLVSNDGWALHTIPQEFRNDKDVVLAAIAHDGRAFQYASPELQNDREVVITAVTKCSLVLSLLPKQFQNDKEIVILAIQHGAVFEYASEELRDSLEILFIAMERDTWAINYASNRLKKECEIVRSIIRQYGMSAVFSDPHWRKYYWVGFVVIWNGYFYNHTVSHLLKNPDFIEGAITIPFIKYTKIEKCRVLLPILPQNIMQLLYVLI